MQINSVMNQAKVFIQQCHELKEETKRPLAIPWPGLGIGSAASNLTAVKYDFTGKVGQARQAGPTHKSLFKGRPPC